MCRRRELGGSKFLVGPDGHVGLGYSLIVFLVPKPELAQVVETRPSGQGPGVGSSPFGGGICRIRLHLSRWFGRFLLTDPAAGLRGAVDAPAGARVFDIGRVCTRRLGCGGIYYLTVVGGCILVLVVFIPIFMEILDSRVVLIGSRCRVAHSRVAGVELGEVVCRPVSFLIVPCAKPSFHGA